MATWKERGEVPDSEDELGYDSDDHVDLLQARPSTPGRYDDSGSRAPTQQVWGSSITPKAIQGQAGNHASEPLFSSPLSDPPSDLDLPSDPEDALPRKTPDTPITRNYARVFSPDPLAYEAGLATRDPLAPPQLVSHLGSPPNEDRAINHEPIPFSSSQESLLKEDTLVAHEHSPTAVVTDALTERLLEGPGQPVAENERRGDNETIPQLPQPRDRVFRPRKPIQQHPYAIENAMYSKVFKSHGLRPLRLELQPEPQRKKGQEEDSQEKDFEEDSQETPEDNPMSEESQGALLLDTQLLQEELGLSSPSTPTTPFPQHRGGPSSQPSVGGDTDNTSIDGLGDRDEFPSLEELIRAPLRHTSSTSSKKRKSLPKLSARKKRLKNPTTATQGQAAGLDDPYRLTPSPPISPLRRTPTKNILPQLVFPDDISLSPPSPASTRLQGPTSPPKIAPASHSAQKQDIQRHETVDLTAGIFDSTDESLGSSSSDTDSEAIRTAGKRLRGVLPPSYLRLNETKQAKAQRGAHPARHDPSPEKRHRRGVAQPRISGSAPSPAPFLIFGDSDDDEDAAPAPRGSSPVPMLQTALVIESGDESQDSSAMEDNGVDAMLSVRKRQSSHPRPRQPGTAKRLKTSKAQPLRTTQPKITSHFNAPDGKQPSQVSRLPTKQKRRSRRQSQTTAHRMPRQKRKKRPVPRLSILDVIQPDAPRFLKIAARSARQKPDLGRSSPSKKIFQMATRWDHVDVNSVMWNWKAGNLEPRLPSDAKPWAPRREPQSHAPPTRKSASLRSLTITKPKKLVKQVGAAGRVTYTKPTTPTKFHGQERRSSSPVMPSRPIYRPAQLEITDTELMRYSFHTKKKTLDNLWRRTRRDTPSVTAFSMAESLLQDAWPRQSPSPPPADLPAPQSDEPAGPVVSKPRRSKFRKRFVPKPIDTAEPQFSLASEPLPTVSSPVVESLPGTRDHGHEPDKLLGLGSFGAQYTYHFEVFPLNTDVFFHETTLLGQGRVDKATDNYNDGRLGQHRPRTSFTLDGRSLRWGPWDDQVSSELGILMDWILDHFHTDVEIFDTSGNAKSVQTADFILEYVQDSMSFPDPSAEQSFAFRILETMKSFVERLEHDKIYSKPHCGLPIIEVLTRVLVIVSTCNHICYKSPTLGGVQMPMELLLVQSCKTAVRALLEAGLDPVSQFLDDSRQSFLRERGIRGRHSVVQAWVVVMRVLEVAHIPRSGFWDVVYSILITPEIETEVNLDTFESLWKTMFTLLPLREFDSDGTLMPGIRKHLSMDGWTLPQRLMRRVFELYKRNRRQAPSFNDYCRALIHRCHYLAQEWGWIKCGGIIGTIFDFFGSQDLSHLRNEEAYKSPRFLEELARNPSLAIEREDKCFHIFLKFVATIIKRLRERDANKEIRNLVARLMPNHSRVYLKEQPLHSHDLASLRNHHDLLCTLFWAAPPSLRPGPNIIEALIKPGDSHKDACLVNLRAWNQLARFIVAEDPDPVLLAVFRRWEFNIFQQLMDQFEMAASDAQQQYLALSKDDSQGITQAQIELVVSVNRTTAKEIIYACLRASYDVLSHARSLEAAAFALNPVQLGEVFKHFSISPATLDWSILRCGLESVNSYLAKAEALSSRLALELSEPDVGVRYGRVMTDLHRELSASFFSMARCVLGVDESQSKSALAMVDKSVATELIVIIAAKLVARFSTSGLISISQAFDTGRYALFQGEVHKLPLSHRKSLVLFVAVLLKNGLSLVDGLGFSLLELWLLAIVKPRQYLAYENQLAEQLKKREEPFVPETVVGLAIDPDYNSNRDLFRFAIAWMRQSLRAAPASAQKTLSAEFSGVLKSVMDQIKLDLKLVVLDPVNHPSYVLFIRDIIFLIRSHGADICATDEYFYQINKEFWPSPQDQHFHLATIDSYGLRLGESDSSAASQQLFYCLYNNFKRALAEDKLEDEAQLLRKGMRRNSNILAFVLGRLMPAVAGAAVRTSGVFPLLNVYYAALRRLFTRNVAGYELTGDMLPHALDLMRAIVTCLYEIGGPGQEAISAEKLHVASRLCGTVNLLFPSLRRLACADVPHKSLGDIRGLCLSTQRWLDTAISYAGDASWRKVDPRASDFFAGLRGAASTIPRPDHSVTTFSNYITGDVKKNWMFTETTISIQLPGRNSTMSSAPPGQGIERPAWDIWEVLEVLEDELKHLRLNQEEIFDIGVGRGKGVGRGRSMVMTSALIF